MGKHILPNEDLSAATKRLIVINHGIRQRIIAFIEQEQEATVVQIWKALNIPQPHVSKHLKRLRDANVVIRYRHRNQMFYQVDREKLMAITNLAKQITEI